MPEELVIDPKTMKIYIVCKEYGTLTTSDGKPIGRVYFTTWDRVLPPEEECGTGVA